MILTGNQIIKEVKKGNIFISPFSNNEINPNSYNYCLGSKIKIFVRFNGKKSFFKEIKISKKGYVLKQGKMCLATTKEVIGSSKYAMSLIGRSSMGRYGLFLQISANLGHTTSQHKWTLEIFATQSIRLYSGMVIGQVSFWKNFGTLKRYNGKYGFKNHPQEAIIS